MFFQLEDKIKVMEQGEGQSSGNEETPYTVVVQIPNPYGDSSGIVVCNYPFKNSTPNQIIIVLNLSDPIYVFGSSNQGPDQTARMTQLYQAVNSVEVISKCSPTLC
jgi:hypothetical protein